ncbi:MAG: endopeptidase La, partial [Myxococcota bacterium]|nr:endopeptidase La [Myxococcota bacterium]
ELQEDPHIGYVATPYTLKERALDEEKRNFWFAKLKEALQEYLNSDTDLHPELYKLLDLQEEERFINLCAAQLIIPRSDRLLLLAEPSVENRIHMLIEHLVQEKTFRTLYSRITEKIQNKLDTQNRNYFLRHQISALREELDEEAVEKEDLRKIRIAMKDNPPPETILKEMQQEIQRLEKMSLDSSEYNLGRNWLSTLAKLPWNRRTSKTIDLQLASHILDKEHYGLDKVKERIIEQLAVQSTQKSTMGTILCLVGPPGVGKTSLAQSVALALGRNFQRISLGGIKDESEIRGHRRTYIGSMPGRVIRAIQKANCKNPLILLDEIDKISRDLRGDPTAALLEVLDPEQNNGFVDHYLDQPFDLSSVFFMCTANTQETIPSPLLDRLEVITLNSYSLEEKQQITEKHLIRRAEEDHGVDTIHLDRKLIPFLIENYTHEAGLRKLNQHLAKIARQTVLRDIRDEQTLKIQSPEDLYSLLGAPTTIKPDLKTSVIGRSIGLAWTPSGGELLFLEAILKPQGKGNLKSTGNLGSVMQESVAVAHSYIQSYHGNPNQENPDLHIHVPQGAISKDGPSAGIGIAIAIYSALHKKAVEPLCAMTGELSLSGAVHGIGGLREKCLAAQRMGLEHVLIPNENRHEIPLLPASLREALTFHLISHMEEVLRFCFPSEEISGSMPQIFE